LGFARLVRAERFVPQGVRLPHVDVVAHHGGSGAMLGALSHGLTQLVLPHGADQFMNAKALLDSGAGRCLLPEESPPTRSRMQYERCSASPDTGRLRVASPSRSPPCPPRRTRSWSSC
jgi:UDP:flavonoid glycosyltransferase YjiC (YdhE family)